MNMGSRTRSCGLAALTGVTLAAAGCGSGSSPSPPKVGAARTFHLAGFTPAGPVRAGKRTLVSFTIIEPSGKPLTAYREGKGPHTGADLIIVRRDDSHLQYIDTATGPGGKISAPVTFPAPGRYRIVIDAYPKQTDPQLPLNFQLFTWVTVAGKAQKQTLPAFSPTATVDGYRFQLPPRLSLHALDPTTLDVNVRTPEGKPARFSIWRGALAHAIFIREGSLDYFHTHVCSPGSTTLCTSRLGATRVTGTSSTPGQLKVGVLVPVPGIWRLFLLTYIDGHQLTAPFTLRVS
jgi:hypothetical protein